MNLHQSPGARICSNSTRDDFSGGHYASDPSNPRFKPFNRHLIHAQVQPDHSRYALPASPDCLDHQRYKIQSSASRLLEVQSVSDKLPDHRLHAIHTWPPTGLSLHSKLSSEHAKTLVCHGALSFQGRFLQASHSFVRHHHFYAAVGVEDERHGILIPVQTSYAPADMSLTLMAPLEHSKPWETLEQPSTTECFGTLPGTITLNRYVGSLSPPLMPATSPPSCIQLRLADPVLVLQRLHFLQRGLDLDVSARISSSYLGEATNMP